MVKAWNQSQSPFTNLQTNLEKDFRRNKQSAGQSKEAKAKHTQGTTARGGELREASDLRVFFLGASDFFHRASPEPHVWREWVRLGGIQDPAKVVICQLAIVVEIHLSQQLQHLLWGQGWLPNHGN